VSVTAIHLPYKKEFEPIVRHLENVAVARSLDEREWKYYRVKYIEPFFIEYTSPTISAGGSLDNVKISDLELHDNELAQIRILIQTDGFEVEVKLPSAVRKYATKNTVTTLKKWVTDSYPQLAELFFMKDDIPILKIYNKSGSDGACTLRIVGFKYVLEELPAKPKEFTLVYVYTVPATRR